MAEITLDTFGLDNTNASDKDKEKGTFRAPDLFADIRDADGNVLGTIRLEARAYSPNTTGKGGVGWFGMVNRSDPMRFMGKIPFDGQVRFSVKGVKIGPNDTVDFMPRNPGDESK